MQSISIKTNANGYVRASPADGIKGFDSKAWKNTLTEAQRCQLRHIRHRAGRAMRKHVVAIRKALRELIRIDDSVKQQSKEVVGGEEALEALFGCKHPLSFDMEQHSKSGDIITPGFEDMLEATETIDDDTEQLASGPACYLPQEDDD